MPPIYITAFVTTVIAFAIFVPIIRYLAPRSIRLSLFGMGAMGLAMSPVAYFFVRLPLMKLFEPEWFGTLKSPESSALLFYLRDAVRLCYAPLTEETCKLLPWVVALLAGVSLRSSRRRSASLALTIGVTFAIGEFWLVAYFLHFSNSPDIAKLPWYAFGGYMSERLTTCFSHTLFVLPTVYLSRHGVRYGLLGLVIGMGLHYLGNAPIVLMHHETFGISKGNWGVLIQFWLTFFVLVCMFCLVGLHYGTSMLRRIWKRQMVCPECHATYRQPLLLGFNMGTWRYERCGACKKWHWVTLSNLAPLDEV
jgi:hypothetical protein